MTFRGCLTPFGAILDRFWRVLGRFRVDFGSIWAGFWKISQALSVVPAGQVAKVEHKDEQLFTALAAAAQRRMKDFTSQDLANTAWAFATVERKDAQLFTALAAAAERRMRNFNSQNLANTAWALTDSAACALESFRSGALGGELGGMGP